jgi:hypothetical protein
MERPGTVKMVRDSAFNVASKWNSQVMLSRDGC